MVKMGAGGSKQDLDSLPVMTMEEVQKHSSETDCWVVISGIVVDATKFLEEHPGGTHTISVLAGTDATDPFDETGHSDYAKDLLLQLAVGRIQ